MGMEKRDNDGLLMNLLGPQVTAWPYFSYLLEEK